MDDLVLAYREWLVEMVNTVDGLDYGPLLRELFTIEFYWTVPHDEDRAMDGAALRDEFTDFYGIEDPLELYFGPARVLEVLIGIARRVEFQLFGRRFMEEWTYKRVFWDFIWNLGLADMFDTLLEQDRVEIHDSVTLFMDHRKKRHKYCNIFGLDNEVKNLQKMNIWAQMMLYIRKKWPL